MCPRLHAGLITGIRQEEPGLQVLRNGAALAMRRRGQSVTELHVRGSVCALLCMTIMFLLCASHRPAKQGSVLESLGGPRCCGMCLSVTVSWYQELLDRMVCSDKSSHLEVDAERKQCIFQRSARPMEHLQASEIIALVSQ